MAVTVGAAVSVARMGPGLWRFQDPHMARFSQDNSVLAEGTLNVRGTGNMNDRIILSLRHTDARGQVVNYTLHLTTQDARQLRDYLTQQSL
jgi:hypothetical protein